MTVPGVFEHTREKGYQLIDGATLYQRGYASVLGDVHEILGDKPVYLCFDMDFFDPSCAPGVCVHQPSAVRLLGKDCSCSLGFKD